MFPNKCKREEMEFFFAGNNVLAKGASLLKNV